MGSLGNINVGMQLDAVDFHRGMGSARAEVRTFGHDVDRMGSALRGVFAGLAVGTAVHGLVSMARQAAHVEEAVHGLGVTFGDQADAMEEHVRRMSGAFKIGLSTLLDKTNQVGSFFQGAGFDDEKTAQFSRAILQAATNMQALKDVPIEIALDKFSSALAGEYVPLRAFGITMNEGAVTAEAYRLGIARVGSELSEFQKMEARASLIVRGSSKALGVAAEEADGAAAKMAGLSGAWENFSIKVGETFAPAIGEAMGELSDLLTAGARLWGENETASKSFFSQLAVELGVGTSGFGLMAEAAGLVADAVWSIGDAYQTVKGMGLVFWEIAADAAAGISDRLPGGGDPNGFAKLFAEELRANHRGIQVEQAKAWREGRPSLRMAKELERLRTEQATLRLELSKPEELVTSKFQRIETKLAPVSFDSFMGQAQGGLGGVAGGMGVGVLVAAAGTVAARLASDPKFSQARNFAPAMLKNSAEAVETILRSKYGGTSDPVAKNTKEAADVLKRIERNLGKVPGRDAWDPRGLKLIEIM